MPATPPRRYRPSYARAFRVPVALAVILLGLGVVLGQVLGSSARNRAPAARCRAGQLAARATEVSLGHARSGELIVLTPRHTCQLAGYPTMVGVDGASVAARDAGAAAGLTPVTITATPTAPLAVLIAPGWRPEGLRLPDSADVIALGGHTTPPADLSLTPIFSDPDAGGLLGYIRMHGGVL